MYQALYRKYRPNTFDEVTGQRTIVRTLKHAISNNKLSHAYLFTGPRGTGKTSIAKILAKTINCVNLSDLTPCNECVSCTQINSKQTTDIIEIDAASNNGVDEIRELRSKVSLVPANSKYKVYIIDEVHMLTVGAFNALLKTLEEPPAHIIFVLATTEPHKIPATILSRCQRFDFKKIPVDEIVDRLEYICKNENIEIERDALVEIARISDGGMRDSISLLDQAISYSDGTITVQNIHDINGTVSQWQLKQFFDFVANKDLIGLLNMIDDYDNKGKNLVKLADEMILFLRNSLIYVTAPNYFNESDDVSCYVDFSKNVSKEQMLLYIKQYNETYSDMKKSANPKLLLELLFIQLTNGSETPALENISQNIPVVEVKAVPKNENFANNMVENRPIVEKKSEISEKTPELSEKDVKMAQDHLKMLEEIKKLRLLRINNALSKFDKQALLKMRNCLDDLRGYILNPEYSSVASLIMDSALKAASDEYLVFVLPDENISNLFNEQLLVIEKMFEETYNKCYKIISTFDEEWELFKEEFNHKKRVFPYQGETELLSDFYNRINSGYDEEQSLNVVEELFGNIVEYN